MSRVHRVLEGLSDSRNEYVKKYFDYEPDAIEFALNRNMSHRDVEYDERLGRWYVEYKKEKPSSIEISNQEYNELLKTSSKYSKLPLKNRPKGDGWVPVVGKKLTTTSFQWLSDFNSLVYAGDGYYWANFEKAKRKDRSVW